MICALGRGSELSVIVVVVVVDDDVVAVLGIGRIFPTPLTLALISLHNAPDGQQRI